MSNMMMHNLTSPAVLFFILGLTAALLKSDLKFPSALSETLSIYLLAAIGLKGGIELSGHSWGALAAPLGGSLFLGVSIPILTFAVCRWLQLDRTHAAALAATYGSVSIVTFGAAVEYLDRAGLPHESYMSAMVVVLESPAIFISLFILRWLESKPLARSNTSNVLGIVPYQPQERRKGMNIGLLKESLLGKSILLMLGAMSIGFVSGQHALPVVKPLFIDLYPSVLVLFLLGMGIAAGERLAEAATYGPKLVALAVGLPLAFGALGAFVGSLCGLSTGGTILMGVLGASSSYIAAPAALRHAVPEANPSLYLGMSLGITFPFNLMIGLPIYVQLAHWLAR